DILYVGFKNKALLTEKVVTLQNNELPKMINAELNDIGISHRLKGRDYLYRAILYSIQKNTTLDTSYIKYVADCYDISTTGVLNAMQTAISKTWNNNSIDELRKKYTAQINYKTGVPTPVEFVGYYVSKITTILGIA
ncbi:MAG: sporulation initiation factor Spo0A C-terminal domain-containing protein, partial [Oscillospiraceae bacterium]|nr:sporulation initiation factor Spo0A C-terminal domain-containing protein [Oscillospiraceae bacterium]